MYLQQLKTTQRSKLGMWKGTKYKVYETKGELLCYSKEPKSMTSFNWLTFFHADINQSEVEDSFQLASD